MITINKDFFLNLFEESKTKIRTFRVKILLGFILGITISLLCFVLNQSSLGSLLIILTLAITGGLVIILNKAKSTLSSMLEQLNEKTYQISTYTIIDVVKQKDYFEASYSVSGKCSMGDLSFNTGKVEVSLGVCLESLKGTPIICIKFGNRKFNFLGAYCNIEL